MQIYKDKTNKDITSNRKLLNFVDAAQNINLISLLYLQLIMILSPIPLCFPSCFDNWCGENIDIRKDY